MKHSPKQPKSGEVVTITAKVTDPDGVASVTLLYQVVNPGAYIARFDAQYAQGWTSVAMHDDGLNGDAAGRRRRLHRADSGRACRRTAGWSATGSSRWTARVSR